MHVPKAKSLNFKFLDFENERAFGFSEFAKPEAQALVRLRKRWSVSSPKNLIKTPKVDKKTELKSYARIVFVLFKAFLDVLIVFY